MFYFALSLLLIYLGSQLFHVPMKIMVRILINALLGCGALVLLNLAGGRFGIQIALNPLTALVAGFLGIPGIVLLLCMPFLL